jgi:hypothetical protein
VDRLTYGGHIITTGTSSYRLRTTTARHHGSGTSRVQAHEERTDPS